MKIAICELYNKYLHGNSNEELQNHYLLYETFDYDDFFEYYDEILDTLDEIKEVYYSNIQEPFLQKHTTIQNYKHILQNEKYYQIHIVDEYEYETGELCCILKTCYVSILQRKWRKYCYLKKIFSNRMLTKNSINPYNVNYSSILSNIHRKQITI